jgi:membrane-associated phospholipid phosphatase
MVTIMPDPCAASRPYSIFRCDMSGWDARLAWQTFNLNWFPIAALGVALLLAIAPTNLSLEPVAFGITTAIAFALAMIAYTYSFLKAEAADPKLVFWLGSTAQVILVTAIVGPLSYVANAAGWPLQDQLLLSIDRAMGVDPEPIAAFVNDHPWLANCLESGYGFIKWPLLGVPIVLALTLRLIRLQQFILALNIALAVTIVISVFVPAIGTYYGLNLSPQRFPFVNTSVYASQLHAILSLRDGSLRQLELFKLAGIVSFPSFHAASAVLYMWALWPVWGLRSAAVAVNVLMIAATPVIGAHYIIDVVGGVGLAAASILLTKYFFRILASRNARDAGMGPAAGAMPQLALGRS